MKKLILYFCAGILFVLACVFAEASYEKNQLNKKEKTVDSALPDNSKSDRTMPGGVPSSM